MSTKAERRLTLTAAHEQAIHKLCDAAYCAAALLRDIGEIHHAEILGAAWEKVSHEVMP